MREVIARRADIAEAARRFAPSRRYWAVVGNGPNKVAAEEVRIKLSELCYKSIACDVTEDKKHIDLSSEPLILVCAAGPASARPPTTSPRRWRSTGPTRRRPIVIASDGEERFRAALRGALGAGGRARAGLRAVGDGRPPVRLRGGAGHRRARPPAP